jgi:hypothetical protein
VVSQFLRKIFGLSLLPAAEVCDCFALECLSNLPNDKRVEQFCDYLLENYVDAESTFPPPVWSECTASSLRTRRRMWVIPFPLQMHYFTVRIIKYLFLYLHCKKYGMRPTSKWEVSLPKDLKNSVTFKKEDIISSKIGQYGVNLFPGRKGGRCVRLTTLPPTCAVVM